MRSSTSSKHTKQLKESLFETEPHNLNLVLDAVHLMIRRPLDNSTTPQPCCHHIISICERCARRSINCTMAVESAISLQLAGACVICTSNYRLPLWEVRMRTRTDRAGFSV